MATLKSFTNRKEPSVWVKGRESVSEKVGGTDNGKVIVEVNVEGKEEWLGW